MAIWPETDPTGTHESDAPPDDGYPWYDPSDGHLHRGQCPEYDGDPMRDADCPACASIWKP